MIKITVQEFKANFSSRMGITFSELTSTLPTSFNHETIGATKAPENVTYTRTAGNKKTYTVKAFVWRENEKCVAVELYCDDKPIA